MHAADPAPHFEAIAPEAAGMPLYRVVKRSLPVSYTHLTLPTNREV